MFDKEKEKSPLFKVVRQCVRMVMGMMTFIRAVRTGDWALHLEALEVFTKYSFAHDMLNYARMIPVYLARCICWKSPIQRSMRNFSEETGLLIKTNVYHSVHSAHLNM